MMFFISSYNLYLNQNKDFEKNCIEDWYDYFKSIAFSKINLEKDSYKLIWDKKKDSCKIFNLKWELIDEVLIPYIIK